MRALLCLFLIFAVTPRSLAQICYIPGDRETLGERVDDSDVITLVKWISATKIPHPNAPKNQMYRIGQTTLQIVETWKDTKQVISNTKKDIILDEFYAGKPSNLMLLIGRQRRRLSWDSLVPVTQSGLAYLKALPKRDVPAVERLEFYLAYLEAPDPVVAKDAHWEFDRASFKDIRKIAKKLPREKLRKWIADDNLADRRGVYGQMLGLCGNREDAKILAEIINRPTKEVRPGMVGMVSGYLLLTGETGLQWIEESKLKPSIKAPEEDLVKYYDALHSIFALDFARRYADTIKKERLKQSMRLMLDDPKLASFAIEQLICWKDWQCQDRVIALYDKPGFDKYYTRKAIVEYLLHSKKDSADDGNQNPVERHARNAIKHLDTIRRTDPETYDEAKRYFDMYYE